MYKKRNPEAFARFFLLCLCLFIVSCAPQIHTGENSISVIDPKLEQKLSRAIYDYESGRYDYTKSIFEQMAESPYEHPLALYYLGEMYQNGHGVPPSPAKARFYHQRSFPALQSPAMLGFPRYQFVLGSSYLGGKGTRANSREGMKWIEKAAQQNFAPAQVQYGLYLKEKGISPIAYFEGAALQNNPHAQTLLAKEYFSNVYADSNPRLAASWLQKAAHANYNPAQYALANMYSRGIGVKLDAQNAVYWYERAAKNGNRYALYILGNAYQNGIGAKVDFIKAYAFYTVGAKLNAEHTKERQHNAQALQTISLSYHQKLEANALATLFLTALYTK